MSPKDSNHEMSQTKAGVLAIFLVAIFLLSTFLYSKNKSPDEIYVRAKNGSSKDQKNATSTPMALLPLDKDAYDKKLALIANNPVVPISTSTATSTIPKPTKWPVKSVYPNAGALLPFNRIVAYYGNFYSKQMGVLGEYPTDVMLSKLNAEVRAWNNADPTTPVVPAIHYIATVAQGTAGRDGDWTTRMPDSEIQKAVDIAKTINAIVFLDVQAGQSTIEREVSALLPFLALPQVHLGIDPEFAMKGGRKPGEYIGTLDATEINNVVAIMSKVVKDNNLPPKMLVVHRFTDKMVTNYKNIRPTPEVQVVMTMDGWGTAMLKKGIYRQIVGSEPVQFTGIKIFYKNDLKSPSTGLLTPQEVLQLTPQPSYIQYQ